MKFRNYSTMKILKVETESDWARFCQQATEDYDLIIIDQKFADRIKELSKKKQNQVEIASKIDL